MCSSSYVKTVEILAHARFDFVIIDTEHASFSMETAETLVRAAHLHDICPVIRVTDNDPSKIMRALDTGAYGAAILAGVGIGIFSSIQAAGKNIVKEIHTIIPDHGRHRKYEGYYSIFNNLCNLLSQQFVLIDRVTEMNMI